MKNICIGDKLQIQCYKHNGKIHRVWDEAIVLDIKKDYMVFGNNRTLVTEAEGNAWKTKEPAILYYFKNEWFNIICQLKKDGIYYYCNIASPFVFDDGSIKYIDYDLDASLAPTKVIKILDENEYNINKIVMRYKDKLDVILRHTLNEVVSDMKNGKFPFNDELIYNYYDKFCKINNYINHHEFIKK